MLTDTDDSILDQAATWIRGAKGLLIAAGAGMGVDSGLPDFRGKDGFWKAYPPYAKLGLSFVDMANPGTFARDPEFAWGFYGHRLHLYRDTVPHAGFQCLRRWADRCELGSHVFTSNIDGAFQKAGFPEEQVTECHGSLQWLQCSELCTDNIWSAEGTLVAVDKSTMRAIDPLPTCPYCRRVARPNVLMFGDGRWISDRSFEQEHALGQWLGRFGDLGTGMVIVECGAGSAVPTVRATSESLVSRMGARLIRINPRESSVPDGQIGIAAGAAETLAAIDDRLVGGALH